MKISLIQPGRNNLKYLKWSYDSIRKNQGNHEVQICVADDASTYDGERHYPDAIPNMENIAKINKLVGKIKITDIAKGIKKFVRWYSDYYKVSK